MTRYCRHFFENRMIKALWKLQDLCLVLHVLFKRKLELCRTGDMLLRKYMDRVMRKQYFCIGENNNTVQLLCLRYIDNTNPPFIFLNSNFQASSHFLWLHNPLCVGPGRKHQRLLMTRLIW